MCWRHVCVLHLPYPFCADPVPNGGLRWCPPPLRWESAYKLDHVDVAVCDTDARGARQPPARGFVLSLSGCFALKLDFLCTLVCPNIHV